MSILEDVTRKLPPPRALFLRWPFGHPLGEPGKTAQQHAVLWRAFQLAYGAEEAGSFDDPGWAWRRHTFEELKREHLAP